jgi:hypothetical protein
LRGSFTAGTAWSGNWLQESAVSIGNWLQESVLETGYRNQQPVLETGYRNQQPVLETGYRNQQSVLETCTDLFEISVGIRDSYEDQTGCFFLHVPEYRSCIV